MALLAVVDATGRFVKLVLRDTIKTTKIDTHQIDRISIVDTKVDAED